MFLRISEDGGLYQACGLRILACHPARLSPAALFLQLTRKGVSLPGLGLPGRLARHNDFQEPVCNSQHYAGNHQDFHGRRPINVCDGSNHKDSSAYLRRAPIVKQSDAK